MMRIAVAHLYHESNTFCLEKTRLEDFEHLTGPAMLPCLPGVDILQEAGAEVIPTIYAQRWSSGTVEKQAFLTFEREILAVLAREKVKLDGVYLSLHGGMTVEDIGSGEYRLLKDIRAEVGDEVPIAVSMDMHANMHPGIEKLANVITGYHTAPHTDAEETQRKAARALLRLIASGERPHPVMVGLPMLLVGERALSRDEPFRTIYGRCDALEHDPRLLAATMFVGMAWSDTPHTAASVLVSPATPGEEAFARSEAEQMARWLFDKRDTCPYAHPSYLPEEAVRRALESRSAPLYLSDSGDNPTAGGVGDSTVLLRLMLAQATDKRILFAPLVDAEGWAAAVRHVDGETVEMAIGSGRNRDCAPVRLQATVLRRGDAMALHGLTVSKAADYVLLRHGRVDIVLVNRQMSFTGPECFASAGVDISDYDIVVLKMGYMFAEIAGPCRENIMALTPGCTPLLITADQYHHLSRPIWPLDEGVTMDA